MGLLALEFARQDSPLAVRHEGAVLVLPHPRDISYPEIAAYVRSEGRAFWPRETFVPAWKARYALNSWLQHHALGSPADIARLSYIIEQYEGQLTYDFQAFLGEDLEALWQARRWRRLLMLADRLPRHSYYSEAVANNPEHAKQIAEAQARLKAEGDGTYHPPMTSWTPEVAVLADIVDAVRGVQHAVIVSNADPKKQPPPAPDRYPRPVTVLQSEMKKADMARRMAAHLDLVAKVLPHKAQSSS